jgi:hypothetical protein
MHEEFAHYTCSTNNIPYSEKFSWGPIFSGYAQKLDPRNKYDCTVYNGHDRTRPQKLNFEDRASAKIGHHENFPLYGIWKPLRDPSKAMPNTVYKSKWYGKFDPTKK